MKRGKTLKAAVLMTGTLLALAGASRAQAQVTLLNSVTPMGNLYRYDYSVVNDTDLELLFVDVQTLMLPDAVQNEMAPSGFQITFDSGLGLVTFSPTSDPLNMGIFAPRSTVGGFQFDSPYAPDNALFTAYGLDQNADLITQSGLTVGPTAVPEPGTVAFSLAFGASAVLALRRRRKSAK